MRKENINEIRVFTHFFHYVQETIENTNFSYKWCFLFFYYFPGQNVRKLIKDGLIIRKPVAVHSRARVRKNNIARRKGRHTGRGIS